MHGYILLGINKSLTSTFRISAIWYKTGSGGCTLLAAYRLTVLKLLPNRCAKSVWLIPLTSRIFLILFINISSCLRKDTLFYCVSNCFIRTIFQHTGFLPFRNKHPACIFFNRHPDKSTHEDKIQPV